VQRITAMTTAIQTEATYQSVLSRAYDRGDSDACRLLEYAHLQGEASDDTHLLTLAISCVLASWGMTTLML
jgi:hypothetical protein